MESGDLAQLLAQNARHVVHGLEISSLALENPFEYLRRAVPGLTRALEDGRERWAPVLEGNSRELDLGCVHVMRGRPETVKKHK